MNQAKETDNPKIEWTEPRRQVEIHLPDGRVISGPRGATIGEFLAPLQLEDIPPVVGAVINGELRELTYTVKMDAKVKPISMGSADGMRIYRRSLTFLLETSFNDLFPGAILTIDHSVSSGGYYCQVSERAPLSESELDNLAKYMQNLVDKDIPFSRHEMPLNQAIEYFRQQGADDKVRLLAHRHKDYLTVYELNGCYDYHHGYMVPSTGYLKWFSLTLTDHGFTLRFPRRYSPTQLLPLPEYPKLLATFRQYGDWLEKLGISNVGALDDAIETARSREIILVSEALHEQHVSEIAAYITALSDMLRVILISGPSASGKTTFSKRLSVQLLARGVSPFPLELDNYFVDRDLTPRDEHGELDFESIDALNRERLSNDLFYLIKGDKVVLPR
jgi:uridine kinase